MPAGVLAAALFIFDGLNVGESRLVLIDGQLIFWLAACLVLGQRWFARYNAHVRALEVYEAAVASAAGARAYSAGLEAALAPDAAAAAAAALRADSRYMDALTRAAWALAVGVVCGNAVSVKFTGLATPAFLGLESIFGLLVLRRAYPFGDLLCVAAVAAATFSFYWYVHFAILPNTGDGDGFMFAAFQRTLLGNPSYDPLAPKPGFWSTMLWLQKDMIVSNASILEPHNWDSVWWEWVLNLRGVLYYTVDKAHTFTAAVYLLGNPVTAVLLGAAVAAGAVLLLLWQRLRHEPAYHLHRFNNFFAAVVFCIAVYACNLLPYTMVKRRRVWRQWRARRAAQGAGGRRVRARGTPPLSPPPPPPPPPPLTPRAPTAPNSSSQLLHLPLHAGDDVRRNLVRAARRPAGRPALGAARSQGAARARRRRVHLLRALGVRVFADQRRARAAALDVAVELRGSSGREESPPH